MLKVNSIGLGTIAASESLLVRIAPSSLLNASNPMILKGVDFFWCPARLKAPFWCSQSKELLSELYFGEFSTPLCEHPFSFCLIHEHLPETMWFFFFFASSRLPNSFIVASRWPPPLCRAPSLQILKEDSKIKGNRIFDVDNLISGYFWLLFLLNEFCIHDMKKVVQREDFCCVNK